MFIPTDIHAVYDLKVKEKILILIKLNVYSSDYSVERIDL